MSDPRKTYKETLFKIADLELKKNKSAKEEAELNKLYHSLDPEISAQVPSALFRTQRTIDPTLRKEALDNTLKKAWEKAKADNGLESSDIRAALDSFQKSFQTRKVKLLPEASMFITQLEIKSTLESIAASTDISRDERFPIFISCQSYDEKEKQSYAHWVLLIGKKKNAKEFEYQLWDPVGYPFFLKLIRDQLTTDEKQKQASQRIKYDIATSSGIKHHVQEINVPTIEQQKKGENYICGVLCLKKLFTEAFPEYADVQKIDQKKTNVSPRPSK